MSQHQSLSQQNNQNRFLAIEARGYGFGIPISSVREIVYSNKINPLPQAPRFVRGITIIRDETMPVLDLNLLLGTENETGLHHESCFIVLQMANDSGRMIQVCLLADRILQTYKLDTATLNEPPTLGEKAVINYILGIGRIDERIFTLIDPGKLISPLIHTVSSYLSSHNDTKHITDKKSETSDNTKKTQRKNKFLSVFIDGDEYAFPLSAVSQVISKSSLTNTIDDDIPDILSEAVIFDDKPLGIIRPSDIMAKADNQKPVENEHPPHDTLPDETSDHEVVVLVQFKDSQLGIVVDSIGKTYETGQDLKQNLFCNDIQRHRITSLGFIDHDNCSIEVIDPIGLLSEKEQNVLDSWTHCVDRVMDMSEPADSSSARHRKANANGSTNNHAGSYLIVETGNSLVGLKSSDVDEMLTFSELIPLDGGPKWFPGLLDLRQNTYPVIDLRIKLDIDTSKETQDGRNIAVMVKHKNQKIALLIDRIIHSTHISPRQIHGTEKSELIIQPEALDAVAETDSGLIHIINLPHVIEAPEISARHLIKELKRQTQTEHS